MDGIDEVITFNEDKITLKTSHGLLNISGTELNISKLNLDETIIEVSGKIDSLSYNDNANTKNIFKRIFK
jgi:sporulation protein YabP